VILGQTKKKESDDDQLGTESPACQITAMISDKPLPKLKIRQQKLESRKTVKNILQNSFFTRDREWEVAE